MLLKYKLIDENIKTTIPHQAYDKGSAGWDIYATSVSYENGIITYGTNLSFEFSSDYVMLLFQRSSIYKKGMMLTNAVGVIDSNYRGEVMFKFYCNEKSQPYNIGEAIGQFILFKLENVEIKEEKELSDSVRGTGGFGSSSNK